MRARAIVAAATAVLTLAGCASAESGTGHGSAPVSRASAGNGSGGFQPAGGSAASSAGATSGAGSAPGSAPDWADHTDFARLSHPDLQCAAAREGGRVVVGTVVQADVTGDGLPDAIVRAACAHSASEWPDSVYVYSDASGSPQLIGTLLRQADASYAPHISASGRTVTLGLTSWSHYAAGCCPDLEYSQTFTWTGSAFTAGARTDVLHPCDGQALPITTRDGGGAAGHAGLLLVFHNDLPQACTLTGYPGVDAQRSSGPPVHAVRSPAGMGVHTVTLAAGAYASAVVFWDTTPTGSDPCTATSTALLVTPPNTAATATVAAHVGLCNLQVYPTVAGQNGP